MMDHLVEDVSKMRVYGSTHTLTTISTDTYTPSSSSASSSDNCNNNALQMHHMRLDMSPDENNSTGSDSTDMSNLLSSKQRTDSSFSDISCDDGGGYYSQSKNARYFFHNSVFTVNNFKVVLSFAAWFVSYMIMGVFGGSVAYMHFERSNRDVPDPLPDFGYEVIPYFCPHIPHVPHGNVQSVVLFILYTIILSGVVLRWTPRFHPKSGTLVSNGDGRLILQHMCHLNCLVFLTRTTTVGLTGLPQPNPKCVEQQHLPVTFENALQFVMGRGFVPHACGDLIYSGHVGCTLICMAVLHRHGFMKNKIVAVGMWIVAAIGIYFTISCRSHYSVDVVLAFYFGYFLPEWYYNRSDGRVMGRVSRWIRKMEVRPEDLQIDDDDDDSSSEEGDIKGCSPESKYPMSISV
mmetsp:Transcript_10837/g.18491  ORF Transcript_10837/g.18491 Transcript_10837/m.18491 type:complete len:405 (-) Transcript_10837:122-1336(-)